MKPNNYDDALYENKELKITKNSIPGMFVIDLVIHGDDRGWFKENFQKEKLEELGFPTDFNPIQNNISSNKEIGVTRGIHAEPWNKFISLSRGIAHIAIVDLREGPSFGTVEQLTLTPAKAIYVPKGCGNSYQTQTTDVEYSYLVDKHWSANVVYKHLSLFDPALSIDWPIPLNKAIISEKDKSQPLLSELSPYKEGEL